MKDPLYLFQGIRQGNKIFIPNDELLSRGGAAKNKPQRHKEYSKVTEIYYLFFYLAIMKFAVSELWKKFRSEYVGAPPCGRPVFPEYVRLLRQIKEMGDGEGNKASHSAVDDRVYHPVCAYVAIFF